MSIKSRIRTVPNFPKEGIMFRDISTLLGDSEGLQLVVRGLVEKYQHRQDIDLIVGIESRGFILGSALAFALKKGFVMIRKPGKLPGKTIATKDVPYNGFNFRIPGTVSYNASDAFTIDFYCDATTQARIAMENWITETYNDETTSGDGVLHNNSTVTLVQLDTQFEPLRTYKLHGVFPTDCGDIGYSMTGDGEVATVTVTVAYQFFRRDNELNTAVNAIGKLAGAVLG